MNTDHHPHASDRGASNDGFVVLDQAHREMLAAIDELQELIVLVERVGSGKELRRRAAAIAMLFTQTVHEHHEDEERHVFPTLIARGDATVVRTVTQLKQDHGWLQTDWSELQPQVLALAAGYGSYDLDELRHGAAVFAALLRDHIALEESLIYPQARAALGAAQRLTMGREMAARRRERRRDGAASG